MSNALAIASVTAVLKDLLNNGLIDHDVSATLGNVTVTALSPDRIDTTSANQQSQLNLFLYQVSPNAGWRNVGLPARNANGERVSNPPLALNLHYLLTAYGALEFHAEILLGYGLQLLHETPVLSRNAIRTALAPPSPVSSGGGLPAEMQALFTSELAEQIEQIKIVPETLNSEEISRMWTAFQAHYRPSAAYQVSAVLIESRQAIKSTLPVRARNVYVTPFDQPVIEQIKSQAKPGDPILFNQPILPGQNIVIAGRGLRAEDVRVNIGGLERAPAEADVTDSQIILPIPAELQAGLQGVQVIHRRLLGSPPAPHRGVESNPAAFVLRPRIETITLLNVQGSGVNPRSAAVTLTVTPAIGDRQRVVLLLNELVLASSPPREVKSESYSFIAPPRVTLSLSPPPGPPGSSQTITIPIKGVKAATYLTRVQIDGAESVLDTNASGQFNSPAITIP
jgi:Pvc16 N-terminal domain